MQVTVQRDFKKQVLALKPSPAREGFRARSIAIINCTRVLCF